MFFYRLLKFAHMLLANHPMCIKCQSGGRSKPTKLIYQPKNAFLHKPKGHQRVARPDETRCIELDLWEICFRIFFFLPKLNFVTVRPGFSLIGTKAFLKILTLFLSKFSFHVIQFFPYRNLIQLLKRPNICYI